MATNTNLSKLLTKLGTARQASAALYDRYKAAKEAEDGLREQVANELRAIGLRSAKGEDFTAVIQQKPSVVIKHEQSVIEWLREAPNIEFDQYVGLKKTEFAGLARSVLQGTGEVIPGTEIEVRETLAIRANKKKE